MTRCILIPVFFCLVGAAAGCKSTPVPMEAPPFVSAKVPAGLDHTWTSTRDVMLEKGLEIYVRDKRGLFVAYTEKKRKLIFFPRRTKLTVTLSETSPGETLVSVETIRQNYRVTLLTYPDWRDVPGSADEAAGQALLDAIVAHATGIQKEAGKAPKA